MLYGCLLYLEMQNEKDILPSNKLDIVNYLTDSSGLLCIIQLSPSFDFYSFPHPQLPVIKVTLTSALFYILGRYGHISIDMIL